MTKEYDMTGGQSTVWLNDQWTVDSNATVFG